MKTTIPTVNDIYDDYYYHHCTFIFKNGVKQSGRFNHGVYKVNNQFKGWNITFDDEQSISNVFHDQIASIERPD
jgi:hypothetical protein